MRKIELLGTLIYLAFVCQGILWAEQATYYVSPSGSDSNSGTIDSPFRTITKARDVVDGINGDMTNDIIVYLRGGTYSITDTVVFYEGDGGTNGYKIIYQAYPGETPIISGGEDLTGDWSLYENGIYKKTGVTSEFRQLYVDGQTAVRARTPNIGSYNQIVDWDTVNKEIKIYSSEISNWNNFSKVEIVNLMNWAKAFMRLSSFRTDGSYAYITLQSPEHDIYWPRPYPAKGAWGNSHSYYFENAYEFLDAEGEWYLDTVEDTLYYRPRSGETMGTTEVMVPTNVETLLKVQGTLDNPVTNLTFYGITFEYSNWTRPNSEGAIDAQAAQFNWKVDPTGANNQWVYRPPSGILVIGAQNIRFERNIIRNMAATGIDFEYGTKSCEIIGNVVTQIAGNGISVGKFTDDINDEFHAYEGSVYNPADTREICTDDIVKNNYVYKTAQYYGGCAIAAGYPKNLDIEHNEIEDCLYSGISVGFGWTSAENAMSDNFIAYNRIHNVVNALEDGAAIYTLSLQPGTQIIENYCYSIIHGNGIYNDEQSGGTIAKTFVVENNAIPGGAITKNNIGLITYNNNVTSIPFVESNSGLQPDYANIKNGVAPTPILGGITRSGWSATAYNSYGGYPASNGIDSDSSSAWKSGAVQSVGSWYQIDMGSSHDVNRVIFTGNQNVNGDFPTACDIFVSDSTSSWGSAVASVAGNTSVTIDESFTAKTGRYIRIEITQAKGAWWDITDFNAYGAIPESCGTILREWWTGISGTAINDLTSNVNYPNNPTGSEWLTSLEGPAEWADFYGSRIRGYIYPPSTGSYTFWIAGDDNCELYLSSDSDPANASLIASVPDWTNSREWTKYSEQQSSPITLTGGQIYYIEVLQKEGTFGDNLAVAWEGPDLSQQVIGGSYLSPWGVPLFIDDPIYEIDAIEIAAYSSTIADDASDPESDPMIFSKVSGPDWLTVAPGGTLSGIPHDQDVGENSFTVIVTDASGLHDTATMTIQVANVYSGTQGIEDLAGLAAQWLATGCGDTPPCGGASLDGDSDVDLSDFAELASNWQTGI